MAQEISINRSHDFGYEVAMYKAKKLVAELSDSYGLTPIWSGNTATFKHGLTRITGTLKVSEDEIWVYVDLNLLQRPLKRAIEAEIHRVLDEALAN